MSKVEEVRDAMMSAFDAAPDGSDASLSMARAAIEAMKTPTDAMQDAAYKAMTMRSVEDKEACYLVFRDGFSAAIDAALENKGEA